MTSLTLKRKYPMPKETIQGYIGGKEYVEFDTPIRVDFGYYIDGIECPHRDVEIGLVTHSAVIFTKRSRGSVCSSLDPGDYVVYNGTKTVLEDSTSLIEWAKSIACDTFGFDMLDDDMLDL
jgi:hypothetical protein